MEREDAMSIPHDFQFSQGNLQDYVDCPRRFQLRYVLQRAWPAPQAEPLAEVERRMQMGQAFHRLVHQHVLGIPTDVLSQAAADPDLARWWHNYLTSPPPDLPTALRRAEVVLSTPLGDHRLVAKYDLIAITPGERAVIVDWKTSRRRPTRSTLEHRLQTRLYRYLLVEAGTPLNERRPISPEQVEMIYWFSEFPTQPEHFPYDSVQFTADGDYLSNLIAEIGHRDEAVWPLTSDERRCRFCCYRSLCECDVSAGALDELNEEQTTPTIDLDFDLEQIAEIAF
jgi:CRISPR/Cas system-associated exonuclease Cas4 (RecB family)